MNANDALDAIYNEMSGKEWNADTLDAIAAIMMQMGYELEEPKDD